MTVLCGFVLGVLLAHLAAQLLQRVARHVRQRRHHG